MRKTKVIIQHNDTCDRLRRSDYGKGRNQLMVTSQEQVPFMFLVMHTLPERKNLKQHMMQKTEVIIQNNDTPCG